MNFTRQIWRSIWREISSRAGLSKKVMKIIKGSIRLVTKVGMLK